MRKIDKKNNMVKANLLAEQRYLSLKENENLHNNPDVSMLTSLKKQYPDLVNNYWDEYGFTINKKEKLTTGEYGMLLPSYTIELRDDINSNGIKLGNKSWLIDKHDYTPNGRDRDKTIYKLPENDVDKVFKIMVRIINGLLKKANKN